ncbi:MarR family winged helix-turn-helix transcriptional regulator [Pelagibacterium halotolerans]|uniref:MarR family transcriptional regulator n=1 Tax=Pelagibacterium halotolerans (strain DSM 22347 / JCM 15775 / CGMCC 1.7692 / B2) TaxID=1082931 RepID=G4R7K5_PELHB|nr:MarR family winged helix-turn-helix transcriptional regulator [Pelagibacterium halotolerans]AEQ52306.1 hypothetical protein KKY_2297 [Pelagibacterium halotolerans B2]QJR17948.1 winged helix-turn-helix transcriptional regulator [Pelagibacterium halotolerans]SEA32833.1 transcriptional regulator, MarR family with acetyltransferase activity [Pelagibacterium halotolerans]
MTVPGSTIDSVRASSRRLVRELGFMGGPFAGTDLSPSAVHALIEIEADEGITARALAEHLRLEKSSVSRMLAKLVASGDLVERADSEDGRAKRLYLGAAGRVRLAAIHSHAQQQVSEALGRLTSERQRIVADGLALYASALGHKNAMADDIEIVRGYRPGVIGRITEMHALYYARSSGFGRVFESRVAEGLADFCGRFGNGRNGLWLAMRGGEIVGSVAIDGDDLGPGIAHLRWFIVGDGVRGGGVGRRLLAAALAFADQKRFAETHLWTVAGLAAARHLYEAHGFTCVDEWRGEQWGKPMTEQRFVRRRP